ncbi:helix-turn-helix transcriptional regulator [Mucilaginibacter boryungensis]
MLVDWWYIYTMNKAKFPVYDISSISNFTKDDIMISRFAPYLAVHKNLLLPHKHDFYHLVLFTTGAGSHVIDFQSFPVNPYQIYFMVPGQVHSWNFKGPVDGYVINFSVSFFNSFLHHADYLSQFAFFDGISTDQVIDIPENAQNRVGNLFEQLIAESESPGRMGADMVRVLMLELFITISRLQNEKPMTELLSYNYTLLKNFQQLIDKNFTKLRMPHEYAAMLYITPNHLNALCNDVLGISAGEVIRRRVTLEAKRLLINFKLSITEIARQLNFQDNSYFTKFFKKQEGLAPEEFRKSLKQE